MKRLLNTLLSSSQRTLLSSLLCLLFVQMAAQQVVLNKQGHFPKTVPAGNYSGITWLGGDRYALANDKGISAGFHLMTIRVDKETGTILEVQADSFVTDSKPNRDEEGICYVPQANTVFVSGEADGHILEYHLDGQLTGRELNIPAIFKHGHKNGGFEALTYSAKTHRFWTTTENTLTCDGESPSIKRKIPNMLRLQSFADNLQPCEQYWYKTDSSEYKGEKGKSTLGVSGMAALDDGQIIVLEREILERPKKVGSYAHIKLYVVRPCMQKASDLLQKQLLAEFRTKINLTDRSFANYEGICVGPRLNDGRTLLILVADSQDQHKGFLKDWFKTITVADLDFRPQQDATSKQSSQNNTSDSTGKGVKVETPAFLSDEELPHSARFVADPPRPGDGAFENDRYYYNWGKEQRQTARAAQALLDEEQALSKAFSAAAGFNIDANETPEIFKLAEGAVKDARATNKRTKNHFRRTRPFVFFNEPSLNPVYDKEYKESYSFPSGHSIRGWVYGLTLSLVVPDSTEALIQRAQEFALNRVICGRHWKSDVDASLVEATAVMSRLMSNEAFTEQLKKARIEYARLRQSYQ